MTAPDCVASVLRWTKLDLTGRRLAASMRVIEAKNTRSFAIELSRPVPWLLDALAKPSSQMLAIFPKQVAETPPNQNINTTIGSGPFRFVNAEYKPGVKVVYERNPDYRSRPERPSYLAGGKVVKVDRVEWISFPDMQTTVNALKKGEIDLIEWVTADTMSLIKGVPGVETQRLISSNTPLVKFNWLLPPFNDVRMRQAVQQLLTQQDIMDGVIGDPQAYEICGALFGCGTALETHDGEVGTGKPNPERAQQLMKDAGYAGEPIVVLNPGNITTVSAVTTLIVQILRQAGMNIDLQTMDMATWMSRRTRTATASEGGWNLTAIINPTLDLIAPLSNINLDARGSASTMGWPSDPELERLKEAFSGEGDVVRRKQIAVEIQKRAYEQVLYVPLGNYFNFAARRSNVTPLLDAPVSVFWELDKT